MEEIAKSYYFTCTDKIASQLLAGQSIGNMGMIDVYLFQNDAFKARHPVDNCLVELGLFKEYLKHVTSEGIYAMTPVDYLVPCLKAVYPLTYIVEQRRKIEEESRMRCRIKCECEKVNILPTEENSFGIEDTYRVVCCKCRTELFRGSSQEAKEFATKRVVSHMLKG